MLFAAWHACLEWNHEAFSPSTPTPCLLPTTAPTYSCLTLHTYLPPPTSYHHLPSFYLEALTDRDRDRTLHTQDLLLFTAELISFLMLFSDKTVDRLVVVGGSGGSAWHPTTPQLPLSPLHQAGRSVSNVLLGFSSFCHHHPGSHTHT